MGDIPYVHSLDAPTSDNSPASALNDQNLVETYLDKIAPDIAPILSRVAFCETHYRNVWNYMNPTGDLDSKWSAFGYFQITKSTGLITDPSLDRMNPLDNIKLAVEIYRKRGSQDWSQSKSCWIALN